MGTPVPLSYGFFRATGMQINSFEVLPTIAVPLGTFPAGMQIGMWDLGEGELDGCDALWIDSALQFALDSSGALMGTSLVGVTPSNLATTPTLNYFTFSTGCDGGNAAGISSLWTYFSNLVTPLTFSRRCYYAIGWTPPTSGGGSLTPLVDWRGMRCRIFDQYGNQTAYRFTTNPIWHFVDLWLRRAIKPDYAIDSLLGPTPLTAAEAGCFNWASIYAAAQFCDHILPNGSPRFSGSYVFTSGSTLAAMIEQVLLCCRGYWYEYAGQIFVFVDQPRASTFTVAGKMLVPGSIEADQTEVNQAPNRFIATYLELGLPAVAQIATAVRTATNVKLVTVQPNPCAPADIISVGGVADPTLDACYDVTTTPTTTEVDCTISGGVASSSTGGWLGYIQSRFSQRTPEISHVQHQMAEGQVLPPNTTGTRLKRIKVSYDFANMTYDQAMRLLQYEVYRSLGLDFLNPNLLQQVDGNLSRLGNPYQPPFGLTLSLWSESVDVNGNALKAQFVGDIITLDPTVFFEFAGDWEIIDRYTNPIQQEIEDSTSGNFVSPVSRSGALTSGTDQNSGILQLVLRTFNRSVGIFTDASVAPNASFQTVPGQLPYAGAGISGLTVQPGATLTATTYYGGSWSVSWTSFSVQLGSGVIVSYPGGGASGSSGSPVGVLYVDDPTFGGGGGVTFGGGGMPAPGLGIFLVCLFTLPTPPSSSVGPPNTITVSF
jgi:hypothetical protein